MNRLEGDQFGPHDVLARRLSRLRRRMRVLLPRARFDVAITADIVQDSLQTHLRQAVLHRIDDALRQDSPRPSERAAQGVAAPDPQQTQQFEDLIGVEAARRYYKAMQRMPSADREAIVARLELGYNYEQIGLILGRISPAAARAAVVRSISQLAIEMDRDA